MAAGSGWPGAALRAASVLCLCASLTGAEDRWIEYRSGPFEVYSLDGERPGRAALFRMEQFRNALGQAIGENDLTTPMPLRIFVFRKSDRRQPSETILTGRDRYAILLNAGEAPSAALQHDLTRLFLESNVARMPTVWERAVEDLFSTLEIDGMHITIGKPPARPDKDWARAQLIATSQDYYGKLRVILYNLRKGVPPDAAYRNAIGKGPAEFESEVERYFAAGRFGTAELSSRSLSEQDFRARPVAASAARLALADLLLPDARTAYEAMLRENLNVPESHEGLALLALRDGRQPDALREFAAAMAAGSRSARCYVEYGRLETDAGLAMAALRKAAELNPKLGEPHFLLAAREIEPARRIAELKLATTLDPRQLPYWQSLAEACIAQGDFACAAKAWTAAEQAAANDADRARMRQARAAIERQRLDYEATRRKREAEENARELEKLKAAARAEVRALETRANQGAPAPKTGEKVVPWWDGPKPGGNVRGNLKQVDCLGGKLRLVVAADGGKTVRLLVPDPSRISLLGAGELTLACGPQQKPRRVSVEYFPKPDSKLATAGEVAAIEFQ